ncbi:MAG TPA: hypothetical protein VK574_12535 [Terracidiphilus sp.]|nr:hypothetical protein [Terracidiphilus sp.]
MDCRRAGLLLYALQIAAQLTGRTNKAEPSESVRSLYNLAGAPIDPSSTAFDDDAELLAPDKTVCEPPHDCPNCPRQETCENYQESDDDQQEDSDDDEESDDVEGSEDEQDEDDLESGDNEDDDESEDDDTDDMEDDE